MYKLAKLAISS